MEERRADYPNLIEKLDAIKTEVTRIATQVEERNTTAILWRNEVCGKFKEMKGYCQTRQDSKAKIWIAIITIIASGLIGVGTAYQQIKINSERLTRLEEPLFRK